mmetsp:Transcript_49995/g.119358  ORF Transcript_49995/g.119358 Transcript_49995/m.119358 type:complete len:237 (-) Transcript_49995:3971-4681(-)
MLEAQFGPMWPEGALQGPCHQHRSICARAHGSNPKHLPPPKDFRKRRCTLEHLQLVKHAGHHIDQSAGSFGTSLLQLQEPGLVEFLLVFCSRRGPRPRLSSFTESAARPKGLAQVAGQAAGDSFLDHQASHRLHCCTSGKQLPALEWTRRARIRWESAGNDISSRVTELPLVTGVAHLHLLRNAEAGHLRERLAISDIEAMERRHLLDFQLPETQLPLGVAGKHRLQVLCPCRGWL